MSFVHLLTPADEDLIEHYPNPAEHAADRLVHGLGLLAAILGGGYLFMLALERGGVTMATGAAVFAFGVMAMLTASAVYNFSKPSRARRLLRRIDEGVIFLMIAGSYTPFTLKLAPDSYALLTTAAVWLAAFAGAAGKVLVTRLSDRAWCLVYLAFGWVSVVVLGPIALSLPPLALGLLVVSGLVYSGGVLLYLNHTLPYRRALWHGCVVLGAAGHYGAVLYGLVLAGA